MNKVLDPIITRDGDFNVKIGDFDLMFFTRYVDDILVCIADEKTALEFKVFLETLHPNLKFKIELEENNCLPFLDILICKEESRIVTKVYRKPSHSGVLTHYRSYVPFRFKLNMINTLLDRAYKICSTWETVVDEFQKLSDMLNKNGYNKDFVSNYVGKFLDKKFNMRNIVDNQEDPANRANPRKVYCRLPYLEGTSSKVQKTIRGFLTKFDPAGTRFKVIFLDNCTKLEDIFRFKDQGPELMRSNVVYHLTCSCNAQYIGETERNLCDRLAEHSKTTGKGLSAVGEHLRDNPSHTVDFQNPKILGGSQYHSKLLIKEALFIQEHSPSLNIQVIARKLHVFNI